MKRRYYVISAVLGVALAITTIPAYLAVFEKEQEKLPGQIYVTAAHIDPELMTGYTLMYSDEERDAAYYLKDDYEYHYPEIGDTVYYDKYKAKVVKISEGIGFYVEVEEGAPIYKGMSGTRIRDASGKDIAFIAKAKGDSHLLCVCID